MTAVKARAPAYHHGDLRNALLQAARTILEDEGLEALSLRAVARKAGVSHAAPYRHFPNHETLLAELALEGFAELRPEILKAAGADAPISERVAAIASAYMRFAVRRSALMRLMFDPAVAGVQTVTKAMGDEIGAALHDPVLGLAAWSAAHGLAMLALDDAIDLGQHRAGRDVLPSRAEIVIRRLFHGEQAR